MANPQHAEDKPQHVTMPGDVALISTAEPASRGPVIAPGVGSAVPSFAAASEQMSGPYSCLVMNTHRRHIALPPVYLNKKKTGIKEELDAELLRFSQSLSGVPLAYDNIRIVGQQGDIFDDSGYIHLNIEANFIVFQPTKGQTLLGKVNKLGPSHVGCLVHGCFNASIPKPNLVSMETWRDLGPQIGSDLEFDVTALDADTAGVLLIRGRLKKTRVQELLSMSEGITSAVLQSTVQQSDETDAPNSDQTTEPMASPSEETPKKKKKNKKNKIKEEPLTPEKDHTHDTPELNGTFDETVDGNSHNTEKKKKKRKRDKIKEEEIEEPVTTPFSLEHDTLINTTAETEGVMNETNGDVERKKKKKKEKHFKEEPQEVKLLSLVVPGSDSSGYFSEKPSKKRKLQPKLESSLPFYQEFELLSKEEIKTLIELKTEIE